jgi:hypothetical protein
VHTENRIKVAVAGTLEESRGVSNLIRSIGMTRNKDGIALVLVGGEANQFISGHLVLASEVGIGNQLHYSGYVD